MASKLPQGGTRIKIESQNGAAFAGLGTKIKIGAQAPVQVQSLQQQQPKLASQPEPERLGDANDVFTVEISGTRAGEVYAAQFDVSFPKGATILGVAFSPRQ